MKSKLYPLDKFREEKQKEHIKFKRTWGRFAEGLCSILEWNLFDPLRHARNTPLYRNNTKIDWPTWTMHAPPMVIDRSCLDRNLSVTLEYKLNGVENTYSEDYLNRFYHGRKQAYLLERFRPDIKETIYKDNLIINRGYIEVKGGLCISKDAFETYQHYNDMASYFLFLFCVPLNDNISLHSFDDVEGMRIGCTSYDDIEIRLSSNEKFYHVNPDSVSWSGFEIGKSTTQKWIDFLYDN